MTDIPTIDVQADEELKALEIEATRLAQRTQTYSIQNAAAYTAAGEELTRIKGLKKAIEAARVRITKPLNDALRATNDLFRQPAARLTSAETAIKRAMVDYDEEQRRRAAEEQRKLEEAARKEREKLEARAAKAEASGKLTKAEDLAMQAAMVHAPVVQADAPKVSGISTRMLWKFDIEDEAAIPREFLMVDTKKIGRVVAAMREDAKIPGVRVYAERSIAARSA